MSASFPPAELYWLSESGRQAAVQRRMGVCSERAWNDGLKKTFYCSSPPSLPSPFPSPLSFLPFPFLLRLLYLRFLRHIYKYIFEGGRRGMVMSKDRWHGAIELEDEILPVCSSYPSRGPVTKPAGRPGVHVALTPDVEIACVREAAASHWHGTQSPMDEGACCDAQSSAR